MKFVSWTMIIIGLVSVLGGNILENHLKSKNWLHYHFFLQFGGGLLILIGGMFLLQQIGF